jgi:hypothetical protein
MIQTLLLRESQLMRPKQAQPFGIRLHPCSTLSNVLLNFVPHSYKEINFQMARRLIHRTETCHHSKDRTPDMLMMCRESPSQPYPSSRASCMYDPATRPICAFNSRRHKIVDVLSGSRSTCQSSLKRCKGKSSWQASIQVPSNRNNSIFALLELGPWSCLFYTLSSDHCPETTLHPKLLTS